MGYKEIRMSEVADAGANTYIGGFLFYLTLFKASDLNYPFHQL